MKSKKCRVCKDGTLQELTTLRTYYPNKQAVKVELVESHCEKCGAVSISSTQHTENLSRLAARKDQYGNQLMGEEYVAFRKRYGLTQRQASKIFGKGLIAFSRYENEDTYPDSSTRLLIELAIIKPEILKTLADKAGVEIPLWEERVEDGEQARRTIIALKDNGLSVSFAETNSRNKRNEHIQDLLATHFSMGSGTHKRIGKTVKINYGSLSSSSTGGLWCLFDIGRLAHLIEVNVTGSIPETHSEPQHYVFNDDFDSEHGDKIIKAKTALEKIALGGAA